MTRRSLTANSLFSALSWAVPAVAYIVCIPVTVRGLGPDAYGILVLASAIAGYLGLMELGLGQSVVHSLSLHRALNEGRTVRAILRVGCWWFLGTGAVGAVLLYITAPWVAVHLLKAPPGLVTQTVMALRLTGASFFLGMGVGLGSAVPQAFLRYDLNGIVQGALGTASAVGPAVLVLMGFGIVGVSWLAVIVNLVACIGYLVIGIGMVRRLDPNAGPEWRVVRRATLSFAGIQAMARILSTVTAQTSRLAVGYAMGAASAGFYAVPAVVASRMNELLNRLALVIFPAGAQLFAVGDHAGIRALYMRASRLLFVLNASLLAGIVVVAGPLLRYWVGPQYATAGATALVLLVVTQALWATTMAAGNLNLAVGKPSLNLVYALPSSVISLATVYPLAVRYGITGAALSGLLGAVMVPPFFVHTHRAVLGLSSRTVFRRCYLASACGCAVAIASGRFVFVRLCTNLLTTLAVAALVSLLCLGVSGLLGAVSRADVATGRRVIAGALGRGRKGTAVPDVTDAPSEDNERE